MRTGFVDVKGAKRLFRGMAVSYKAKPDLPARLFFDPRSSFAEEDLRLFDKLNLNIVRLGVSWAAFQPSRGQEGFDERHIAELKSFVEECYRHKLYVLIEAHQDLFSEAFASDGFPAWAATTDHTMMPFLIPMRGWKTAHYNSSGKADNIAYTDASAMFYGSDAATRAFWGLYTDFDDVQREFVRFWTKVAETFEGMENVFGYELINEPWEASRTTLHVPYACYCRAMTEERYLQPLYDRLVDGIRSIDQQSLIFWEPVCGSGRALGDGFGHVPGKDTAKSVFSFHSYGPNLVEPLSMDQAVSKAIEQRKGLGGAIMVNFPTMSPKALGFRPPTSRYMFGPSLTASEDDRMGCSVYERDETHSKGHGAC